MSTKVFLLVAFGVLGAHGLCSDLELDSLFECVTEFNDKFLNALSGNQSTQCNRDLITDDLCRDFAQIVTCANGKTVSDTECRPFLVQQINPNLGIPCKIADFVDKCKSAPALNMGDTSTGSKGSAALPRAGWASLVMVAVTCFVGHKW